MKHNTITSILFRFSEINRIVASEIEEKKQISKIVDVIYQSGDFNLLSLAVFDATQNTINQIECRGYNPEELKPTDRMPDVSKIESEYCHSRFRLFDKIDTFQIPQSEAVNGICLPRNTHKKFPPEWNWNSNDLILIPIRGITGKLHGLLLLSDPTSFDSLAEKSMLIYSHFAVQLSGLLSGSRLSKNLKLAYKNLNRISRSLGKTLQNSNEGFFQIDISGKLIFANRKFLSLAGHTSSRKVNAEGLENTIFRNKEELQELINHVKSNERVSGLQFRLQDKSGRIVPVRANCRMVSDKHTGLIYVEGFVSPELADQSTDTHSLTKSEAGNNLLAAIGENHQIFLLLVDKEGVVKFLNRGFQNLTGFSIDDMAERTFLVDLLEDKFSKVERINEALLQKQKLDTYSKLLLKNGKSIPVFISIFPLKTPAKDEIQSIVIFNDISSQLTLQEQQNLLSTTINSSLDGMALLDRSLKINLANEPFAGMYNSTSEEIIGKNLLTLHENQENSKDVEAVLLSLKEKNAWRGDVTLTGDSSSYPKTYDLGIYAIKAEGEKSNEIGFISISRDITDAHARKTRTDGFSRQLITYGNIFVQSLKLKGGTKLYKDICKSIEEISDFGQATLVLFNPDMPYYSFYNYETEGISSSPMTFKEDDRPELVIKKIKAGHKINNMTYAFNRSPTSSKNGVSDVWLYIMLSDETEKTLGFLSVGRKKSPGQLQSEQILPLNILAAQLALLIQVRHLEEKINHQKKEMEEFVYSVSHDLKTPLMSITGFSDMLKANIGDLLDEESKHYFGRIDANIQTIDTMVKDLLNLARASKLRATRNKIDIAKMVVSIQNEMEENLGASLNIEIADDLPSIVCDLTGMKTVFLNLLSNAYKFRDPKRPLLIKIGAEPGTIRHIFYIRDNGIGIPENGKDRIFEPFTRLCPKEIEGTGMGLAIVKKIINTRGGQVWVESQPGKGATFYFSLPST